MSETEDDLRTTSDAVVAGAERLKDLEEAKRGLEPEDPERERLASEIADVGSHLAKATAAEEELARRARKEADASPGSPERPIEG
jgi:hypothetical protein